MARPIQLAVAALLASGAMSGSVQAATLVFNDGSPYSEVVHANSAGSGATLHTRTKPGSYDVDLHSADGIDVGNGDGVANVTGTGGGQGNGFSSLLIDPLVGFSVIQFKIEDFGGRIKGNNLDILVNFLGGAPSQSFLNVALPSNNKFDIFADGSEVFDSIVLSGLTGFDGDDPVSLKFKSVKQISFDVASIGNPVPEPATWAMMILGFGLIGSAMRRRQRHSVRYSFS